MNLEYPSISNSSLDPEYRARLYRPTDPNRTLTISKPKSSTSLSDRYIPLASNQEGLELSHYLLTSHNRGNRSCSETASEYQRALSYVTTGMAPEELDTHSILHYTPTAPSFRVPATALSPLEGVIPAAKPRLDPVVALLPQTHEIELDDVPIDLYQQPLSSVNSTLMVALGDGVISTNLITGEDDTVFQDPKYKIIKAILALSENSLIACSGTSSTDNYIHFVSPGGTYSAEGILRDAPRCIAQAGPFYLIGQRDGTLSVVPGPRDGKAPQQAADRSKIHEGDICRIAISPYRDRNGDIIVATGGEDNRVVIHRISSKTGKMQFISEHNLHADAILGLQFHPSQGSTIASAGGIGDQKVKVWNWETGRVHHEEKVPYGVTDLAWTKHGGAVAVTTSDPSSQIAVYQHDTSRINPHTLVPYACTEVIGAERNDSDAESDEGHQYVAIRMVPKTGHIAALNTAGLLECYELPKSKTEPIVLNGIR